MQASISDARASAAEQPPLNPGVERLTVNGPAPRAMIHVVWPTDDVFDMGRTHRLNVLAQCLGVRLQTVAREKFGTNVIVRTWSVTSDVFRGDGQIHALMSVAPEQAAPALSLLRAEAAALAEKGVDDKLLEQVRIPLMKSFPGMQQGNEWWFSTVLPYAGWQPFRIYWAANLETDYQSIASAEVSALAGQYLVDSKAFAVVGVSGGSEAMLETAGKAGIPASPGNPGAQ
jgi:zinc protease